MIKYSNVFITVNVSGVINRFIAESAAGKSYFATALKNYSDSPSFRVYDTKSYYKLFKKAVDAGLVSGNSDTIFFLDRFDLFGDESLVNYLEAIKTLQS